MNPAVHHERTCEICGLRHRRLSGDELTALHRQLEARGVLLPEPESDIAPIEATSQPDPEKKKPPMAATSDRAKNQTTSDRVADLVRQGWKFSEAMDFIVQNVPARTQKYRAKTRVVSRELSVLTRTPNGDPVQFVIIEHLTCGHRRTSFLIEWQDLVNAYSENPEIRARRRFCRACERRQQKPA